MLEIDCGGDIWLGDNETCVSGHYEHVVHFYRRKDDPYSCERGRRGEDLALQWTEGEAIDKIAIPLIDYARTTTGRLLVHCQSGIHRSPHGILLAAIGRGLDPMAVMGHLTRERWRQAGHCPDWQLAYLDHLMQIAENISGLR